MKVIEASLVMPLTILITVALIGVMMHFYTAFLSQTEDHRLMNIQAYEKRVVNLVDLDDRFLR